MAITRDSLHKRRATGGRRNAYKKKRKYETGRPPALTKLGDKEVRLVRTRGGGTKHRALSLSEGNFSWGSEGSAQKVRILDVVYNSSNNELVRTKTLVKNTIVMVDATPFRKWWEARYSSLVGTKESDPTVDPERTSARDQRRQAEMKGLDKKIQDQLITGRILACISSRPGQIGRADGYILEGKELDFYTRQLHKKK